MHFSNLLWLVKVIVMVKKCIENNTWARGDMEFIFDCSTQMRAANEWDIELNRREIPYLQATIYYFVYYINNTTIDSE